MHHSFERLEASEIVAVWTPAATVPAPTTARGDHARFLDIAAARRRRAMERAAGDRHEDADYWKAVAPAALARARNARASEGFYRLP
jgi:hypothetical protein